MCDILDLVFGPSLGHYDFDKPTGGKYCDDIDECTDDTHRCDNNADCGNTIGSYQCRCRIGFEGDGYDCTDTNECVPGHNECPQHSQCANLMDGQGYSCWCEEGYEYITHKIDLNDVDGSVVLPSNLPLRDRLICNDIDECLTIHPCQGRGSPKHTGEPVASGPICSVTG